MGMWRRHFPRGAWAENSDPRCSCWGSAGQLRLFLPHKQLNIWTGRDASGAQKGGRGPTGRRVNERGPEGASGRQALVFAAALRRRLGLKPLSYMDFLCFSCPPVFTGHDLKPCTLYYYTDLYFSRGFNGNLKKKHPSLRWQIPPTWLWVFTWTFFFFAVCLGPLA